MPLSNNPTFSPALPSSRIFLNISTPVTVDFIFSSLNPTISTSSPVLTIPVSIAPVATVPLPVIENTSSTDIKKALASSLTGVSIHVSTVFINSMTESIPDCSPFRAAKAEPLMIGVSLKS